MNITALRTPAGGEAGQLAIYKRTRDYREQLQLVPRAGLEPGTSGFQVRRPNHLATLPPYECSQHSHGICFLSSFIIFLVNEEFFGYAYGSASLVKRCRTRQ